MDKPTHLIKAWTGNTKDEAPICGADKNDAAVWGYRTIYPAAVTCPACLGLLRDVKTMLGSALK